MIKDEVLNFRQLAGCKSKDGRVVKENHFFRGGPLNNLSEEGKKDAEAIGFKHIYDLRSLKELERSKVDYVPSNCHFVQISANKVKHEEYLDDLDFSSPHYDNDLEEWLVNCYRDFPFDNEAYKAIFEAIKNKQTPIYFHCSAGKDRTGVCAALILYLLDVSKEEIFENYLESYEHMVASMPNVEIPRTSLVFKEWLEESFNNIEKRYGDSYAYFEKEFGIDKSLREELKNYYLRGENE